jgi:hypothetical protein
MASKKPKSDPRVDALIEALSEDAELPRLGEVTEQLASADRVELATALLARPEGRDRGLASSLLRAVASVATDDDVAAITKAATEERFYRVALSKALALVADRVEGAALAKACANLEPSAPFGEILLGAGRHAVRAAGDGALAAVLDERASFVERHRAVLADARADAKEKARAAAGKALMQLAGADRLHAALWLCTEGSSSEEAGRWAAEIVAVEPSIHPMQGAHVLSGDIRDEDAEGRLAAVTDDRAFAILEEALERDWGGTVKTFAYGRPAVFAQPRVFAMLLAAIDARRRSTIHSMFASVARLWARPLSDAQAAQIAERMVVMLAEEDFEKPVSNACHYFMHPGGIPVFRRALEGTLTYDQRDGIYDAVHSTQHPSAHDLLIDRLFVETEALRDLVFSYNQVVPAARQAGILERIVAERSLQAAWMYVACQVHWSHHPRNVVAAARHVLDWAVTGDDTKRRAMILSCGVRAALELHDFDLARRCLDGLDGATQAIDPTEKGEVATVLANKELAKQLADLRANKLDAADQVLLDKVAAARAAGKPIALDNDQLGILAKTKVNWVIHRDATTHEVWWFDAEHVFHYFDGSAHVPPPFEIANLYPSQGYDVVLPSLATYCAGWATEERCLQHDGGDFRAILRSKEKLLVHYSGNQPGTWWYPFTIVFPDAAAASRMLAALAAHPPATMRTVDPFYVTGKKGGAWVYQYGNRTEWGFVAGKEAYWGTDRWGTLEPKGSHDNAVAAFTASENSALQRGLIPREIKLEERIRSQDDLPLVKWLADRARDDDRPVGWLIEAYRAIEGALAVTGLSLAQSVELGPPATAAELAEYDATLPEPMPDEMRSMWSAARTLRWRVGDREMSLLSPVDVIAHRQRYRDAVSASIKRKRELWPLEHLDVFVLDGEEPLLAFDIRQQDADSWMQLGPKGSTTTWPLSQLFGWCVNEAYVDALVKLHPQLKKLNYGQAFAELGGKATKQPAAKPAKATKQPAAKATKKPAAKATKKPATKAAGKKPKKR